MKIVALVPILVLAVRPMDRSPPAVPHILLGPSLVAPGTRRGGPHGHVPSEAAPEVAAPRPLESRSAAGAMLAAEPVLAPRALRAQPKRGGIFRVRGYDPPHFDPHLALNFKQSSTLSFAYNKLVRYKVGPGVPPGVFTVEPDLAERWEEPDDTDLRFPPAPRGPLAQHAAVNGRDLTAEDVKFTFDRFLTEKANPHRYTLDPVDRVEVVDRYTVRFRLKEPFVWLVHMLASPWASWIMAREVLDKYGDFKRPEAAIGTGPFLLVRYEPNVKTVFRRNPDYFRTGLPWWMGWTGWSWRTTRRGSPRTGRGSWTPAPGISGPSARQTSQRSRRAIPSSSTRMSCPM